MKKKLIEVALPLEAINVASAREKSIRHGHPSTLHLWWARRPLAACRAVLFASLVDDPSSRTDLFPTEAEQDAERQRLFRIIERLVQWENSNNLEVLEEARSEIRKSCTPSCPPVRVAFGTLLEEAYKFNAYRYFHSVEGVVDVANRVKAHYDATGEWRGAHLELRATLFRMQRDHHFSSMEGEPLGDEWLKEMQSLYHAIRERWDEVEPEIPPVLDPFCGGGSIPLEAQRLGLEAHGSDLNPVAVLITKALIEIPPKFAGQPPINPDARKGLAHSGVWTGATGLAEDVRYYGKWMRDEAERRIGHLYPKARVWRHRSTGELYTQAEFKEIEAQAHTLIPDSTSLLPHPGDLEPEYLTVIAWIWARTVKCPNPACGCQMPLVRTFALSAKPEKQARIEPIVDTRTKGISFAVQSGSGAPREGTVSKKGAVCLCCATPVPLDHVRVEGKAKRMGAQLMAIVAEGKGGRIYLPPTSEQQAIAVQAIPEWTPNTNLPEQALGFRVQGYGITKHAELFTSRQLVALSTLSNLVNEARERIRQDASSGPNRDLASYADAIVTYLAFAADKSLEMSTSLCTWSPLPSKLHVVGTFGRPALPITWDYAEANLFADSSGNVGRMADLVSEVLSRQCAIGTVAGMATQQEASSCMPSVSQPLVSTDPPYYDNVPYADLSDLVYVWLRRSLGAIYPELFGTMLVPKDQELVADGYRHGGHEKAKQFFETGLRNTFNRMRTYAHPDYPLTIYYAFKQTETDESQDDEDNTVASTGWETFLQGLIDAGFQVTATWPMRTERAGGFRNQGRNSLASSIVLACRPRAEDARTSTRREFVNALRRELEEALLKMMHGNVAPVDLAQATIGPGMAVYSRYSKVIETDGSPLRVRAALQIINQELDTILASSEGEYDGDTRFCLAWFEQFGMNPGAFGDADVLARAKDTSVSGLVDAGVLEAKAGKVRLLKRDEYPTDWNPQASGRVPVWECTQQLVRAAFDQGSEGAAARIVAALGSKAEPARDLAYRLYSLCERKGWAQEALAYNSLVVAWPEITALSRNRNIAMPDTGLFAGGEL